MTEIATNGRDRAFAEGVETEAQAAFFADMQGSELQGYLFSKPLPVHVLQRCLATQTASSYTPRSVQRHLGALRGDALRTGLTPVAQRRSNERARQGHGLSSVSNAIQAVLPL